MTGSRQRMQSSTSFCDPRQGFARTVATLLAASLAASPTALLAQPQPGEQTPPGGQTEPAPEPKPAATAEPAPAQPPASESSRPSILDELDAAPVPTAPAAVPTQSYPFVEYHGYFRLRPDLISNGHLGQAASAKSAENENRVLTTSAILPPLSLWPINNNKDKNQQFDKVGKVNEESAIAGASIRLRLQPTIHVDKDIRVHATFDVFDNYVLGADPDYAGAFTRPDVPLSGFAMTSRPGSIAVKEAYGEWKTMLGLLRVGRQASQWGLGILANGGAGDGWDYGRPTLSTGGPRLPHEGSGYDGDFGSFADRVAFLTKIPRLNIYMSLFYDMVSAGMLGYDPARFEGQVRDLEEGDDVRQYGLVLLSKPLTSDEAEQRRALLEDERKSAFDWGVYLVYRTQKMDVDESNGPAAGLTLADAPETLLMLREAEAGIADLWLRFEQRLAPIRRVVLEAEAAVIAGTVGDAATTLGQPPREREIMMWGAALKGAFQDEGMGYYLDLGLASGDDTGCFGVYANPGYGNDCALATFDNKVNERITGFKFHKNFRVDTLLFRDVIGAVTNTMYVKPTVSINAFPYTQPEMLGVDLSVLYARSMEAEGTPGAGSTLGTELGARGFIGRRGQVQADVQFAFLIPGDAFNLRDGWYDANVASGSSGTVLEPGNAWRLMGHLALMF